MLFRACNGCPQQCIITDVETAYFSYFVRVKLSLFLFDGCYRQKEYIHIVRQHQFISCTIHVQHHLPKSGKNLEQFTNCFR